MDNEKDTSNSNDMPEGIPPEFPFQMSPNDSLEINKLISLSDSDITPDLLEMLERRAVEESNKLDFIEQQLEAEKQADIHTEEGLPAENGAVSIASGILERPMDEDSIKEREKYTTNQENIDPLEEVKMNACYKKYVIYINKDNEEYIDSLSISERKNIINRILTEQNTISKEILLQKKRREKIVQMYLAIITFLITVPIVYFIFNVSMETTIQNYKHSKSNFEVLYKETGKIKLNNK